MNQQFSHFVRSSSFNLTLNEPAIKELLAMLCWETYVESGPHPEQAIHSTDPRTYGCSVARGVVNYLLRRGLISRCDQPVEDNFVLTQAGKLTGMLLMEAGFRGQHGNVDTDFLLARYSAQLVERRREIEEFLATQRS